ncbi:MAG: hypothetical protein QME96_12250 [Myxococcota bacterium]|nr:hypothetical protein [Myxococcota bacterium]
MTARNTKQTAGSRAGRTSHAWILGFGSPGTTTLSRWPLLALLAGAGLLACSSGPAVQSDGGDGDGGDGDAGDAEGEVPVSDPLDPAEFAGLAAEAFCDVTRRCDPPDNNIDVLRYNDCPERTRDGWRDFLEEVFAPLVAAGEFAYDADALRRCTAAWEDTCYPGSTPEEPCRAIFVGLRRDGDPCTLWAASEPLFWWFGWPLGLLGEYLPESGCAAGLFCEPEAPDHPCGHCRPLPGTGEFCANGYLCAPGNYCPGARCQPLSGEGEPCETHVSPDGCAPGLVCLDETARCVRAPGEGDACNEDPYSEEFLACVSSTGLPPLDCVGGRCEVDRAAAGDACLGVGDCLAGLVCDPGTTRCVPFRFVGEGEPCQWGVAFCGSNDLACVPDPVDPAGGGTCGRIVTVGIGEGCGGERRCAADAYCGRGAVCHTAARDGETCYHLPPECEPYCGLPGGCIAAEYTSCAAGLRCPVDSSDPGCDDIACESYAGRPCRSDLDCEPDTWCGGPDVTCVPLDYYLAFDGPVVPCE